MQHRRQKELEARQPKTWRLYKWRSEIEKYGKHGPNLQNILRLITLSEIYRKVNYDRDLQHANISLQDIVSQILNKEDAMDSCKWRKIIKDVRKRMGVTGWMFLLVLAYPVVPDKRPLNGCVCVCVCDIVSQFTNAISDDLTILQVNWTQGKPCALRKMFRKLDIHRKSNVTLTLLLDNRRIVRLL